MATETDAEKEGRAGGLVAWFATNHVAANLLMSFFVAGGLLAVFTMRTELFPTVNPRLIRIQVTFPGATTHEVEDGITRRVEEAVMGIEGVEQVSSVAQENLGVVTLEIEDFADVTEVLDEVETAVDSLADFPPGDAEDPVVADVKSQPAVMTVALHGQVPEITLKEWGARLEDDMLRLPGLSLVTLKGAKDYELSIEVSEQTLREYELTLEDIGRIVAASSQDISAGTVESQAGDILLRVQEKGYYGKAFEDIAIRARPDGSLLTLKDIATIVDGLRDQNLIARYNGEPAVFLQVSRSEAQDALAVEQAVLDYLEGIRLPSGMSVSILENQTEILRQRINLLARNALLGFALVFLVLLLFLDLKLAVWTSLGIPISSLGGLLTVFLFGLSFNMVTLFALIVVLGIVVDDAIVTGESIFVEQENGNHGAASAVAGVKAIRAPVTIGVFTAVAAFAPLAFTTGTLGQILRPIPVFVISILLVSLIEAFTILPAHLSSSRRWSFGIVADIGILFNRGLTWVLDHVLTPALGFAFRWRYAVLAGFVGLLIVLLGMVQGDVVRFVFFPQIEGDELSVTLTMPVGTPFSVTRQHAREMTAAARQVETELERREQGKLYESVSAIVGSTFSETGPGQGDTVTGTTSNRAEVRIQLVDAPRRTFSAKEIEDRLQHAVGEIPNADELLFQSSIVEGGADINIQLAHEEVDTLDQAADRLKKRMQTMEGVVEIADTLTLGKLEIVFELTPAGIAAGLTPADLGRQLRYAFYGYEVQRIQRATEELKVMVRYPEAERERLEAIDDVRINLPGRGKAALNTVATMRQQRTQARVERVDGRRTVNVTADVDTQSTTPEEALSAIMNRIVPDMARAYPGIRASVAGESEDRRQDLMSLGRNLAIALLVIFVLLGAQLRSYVQPLIIMAVIPFGMMGAILGHLLLGFNLSFISIFGMVALTGVVVNDSVVLVDYYNQQRRDQDKADILEAMCASIRRRFRPILLTTMTTSFGLLPILLERSLQARFLIPMAISLAFGLIFASGILLFLLPILVAIVEDIMGRLRGP